MSFSLSNFGFHMLRSQTGLYPVIGWCGFLLAVTACSPGADKAVVAAPPQVAVMTVETADTPVVYEFVGRTISSRRVEIRSRVDGFVEQRVYTEGGKVTEGETLFLMDPKPFEAQLSAVNAELVQQQARLTNASANLKRIKQLAQQNAVAQKELDDALGVYRSASAAVEAAKAKVLQAELDLGYTDIRSPVTGISSFAVKQEGSYVNSSDSLLTYVAQIQPMWVEFSVSENQLSRLELEQREGRIKNPENGDFTVEILLVDGTLFPETGKITFADASLSEKTGTFLLRAEIANANAHLRPGMFVNVRLQGAMRPNAILLPQRAVQQGAQGSFVWIVDENGISHFQPVVAGRWHGDKWFIDSGLKGGDTVVVDGAQKVRAGIELDTSPVADSNAAIAE
jgi:membrane fusion protein (multidrug efflux system)